MCTFHDEAAATVCDVAIGRVRAVLEDVFPAGVTFQHLEGAGTLVQADPALEATTFDRAVRLAIADAQVRRDDELECSE